MTNQEKIKNFVLTELKKRSAGQDITNDTSLILSGKLDSLFIVDLIIFLETEFAHLTLKVEDIKKEDIDTLGKIYKIVAQ